MENAEKVVDFEGPSAAIGMADYVMEGVDDAERRSRCLEVLGMMEVELGRLGLEVEFKRASCVSPHRVSSSGS